MIKSAQIRHIQAYLIRYNLILSDLILFFSGKYVLPELYLYIYIYFCIAL